MATGETFPGNSKYQSDAGGVYSIRLSSDVLALAANTPVTADYTDKRVKVSVSGHGRKRTTGLKARGLLLGLPVTEGSEKYSSRTFAAIRSKTAFDAVAIGSLVTYQSGQWQVIDKINEA